MSEVISHEIAQQQCHAEPAEPKEELSEKEMPSNVANIIKYVGILGIPVCILGWVVYATLNFITHDMQNGLIEIKTLQERSISIQSDMLDVLKDIRRGK